MTDIAKHDIATTHTEVMNTPTLPSDSQNDEQTSGSVQLYSSDGKLRLIPVSTDDPSDPLTWPKWKRFLVLITLAVYGTAGFGVIQSTPLYFSFLIPQYLEQTRGQFKPTLIAELASYPSLCMGIGNFLFVPLSLVLGRRPVFLFCNLLMMSANLWAALSHNFSSHLGARCLQGLAAGISDCLLPLIVLDITFLHRRGFFMGLYWAITAIGSAILLVAAPFLVKHANNNWRVNYWFWFAFSSASLVLATVFLPETLFPRPNAMLEGKVVTTDAYGHVRIFKDVESAEKAGYPQAAKTEKDATALKGNSSYLKGLSPFQKPHDHAVATLVRAYTDMGISLLTPAIFWTLLYNGVLFGGLVALSLTYAQLLQSPPWFFGPATVGTVQVGAIIGAVASFFITSLLVDRLAALFTRRNNGVHEPEHLLPSFILPTLLVFAGLVVYGIVGGNPEKHQWVGVHAAFALYYCGFAALSAISSVWVAEVSPSRAGAAIVLVCGGRNAASFGISYSFDPWIAAAGFQNAHITLGCLFVGIALFGIPLFFVNKKLRALFSRLGYW